MVIIFKKRITTQTKIDYSHVEISGLQKGEEKKEERHCKMMSTYQDNIIFNIIRPVIFNIL